MAVPESNQACYLALYELETVIREFLLEQLTKVHGPLWYRSQSDADTLKRIERGISGDRDARWPRGQLFHPIYYMNFSAYAQLIERRDNWERVFRAYFSKPDTVTGLLRSIEPIRNRIAHNRLSASNDHSTLKSASVLFSGSLSEATWLELLSRPSTYWDIASTLASFVAALGHVRSVLASVERAELSILSDLHQQWWFDELVIGPPYHEFVRVLGTIERYNALPRSYGSAYAIKRMCTDERLLEQIDECLRSANALIQSIPKSGG